MKRGEKGSISVSMKPARYPVWWMQRYTVAMTPTSQGAAQ
jgi:hypothetical protein